MFRQFTLVGFLLIISLPVFSQDKLMSILAEEMKREMQEFSSIERAPYYMEYRVSDFETYNINTSFGSLISSDSYTNRVFTGDLRIGDYELDNTHEVFGFSGGYQSYSSSSVPLPVENDPMAIKQMIWLTMDQGYKATLEQYKMVLNAEEVKENEEKIDFTKEEISVYSEAPLIAESIDTKEWEGVLKRISSLFKDNEFIMDGDANLQVSLERRYFISSEGTRIIQNFPIVNLSIVASILSDDGNILPLYISYDARTIKNLPEETQLIDDAKELIRKLEQLRNSQVAEPYSGPAIFSPRVSGVFFHEIFGHRVEGHRLKDESDGQTFKNKVNSQVLPKFMSVISDPTRRKFGDAELTGYYEYDDQGVKAQKVTLVENGILENFLMSRTPLLTFEKSNGHGRATAGYIPVSRQSNLIVQSDKVKSEDALRKMLMKECKKQNKEFGYYFKDVTGGFTTTDRYSPNAFNIMPTEVYKIYVDGRPDELVRGVDMIGTPLTMFSEIKAAGDVVEVFSGHCGAESGFIPVTAVAPSLFVKKIETQKKMETHIKQPLLVSPEFEFKESEKQ